MAEVNYPAILAEAWAQHLAPREPDAPTVVSTFAGAGGSSLGYSMAGFREVPVYHGDIAKLTVEECLRLAGVQPGELDVLDGSPPCQGFSTAGKRQLNDDRNQLFREFVRLLRGLQPKVFVMENVSGMVKGKMKLVFAEATRELKASGYRVSCRLMNAMYFHVPQSRQRLIWIGVREDLGKEPSHPKAEARPVTVGEAFRGLGDNQSERVVPKPDSVTLRQMQGVKPGQRCRLHHSHQRLSPNRQASTVDRGGGAGEWHIWHFDDLRPITRSEVKRLGAFPDKYQFAGDVSAAFVRIGNSVPPLFMRAIARHIRREILERLAGMGLEPRLAE